jgi:hypothetical protein
MLFGQVSNGEPRASVSRQIGINHIPLSSHHQRHIYYLHMNMSKCFLHMVLIYRICSNVSCTSLNKHFSDNNLRWTGHIVQKYIQNNLSVEKSEGMRPFVMLSYRWEGNIKMGLKNMFGVCGLWLRIGSSGVILQTQLMNLWVL